MKVTSIGGPLHWMVQSENNNGEYTVDLGSFWGNGQCDCPHFRIRLQPRLEQFYARPAAWPQYGLMCKHIIAARKFLLNELIWAQAALESRDERGIPLKDDESPVSSAPILSEKSLPTEYQAVSYPAPEQSETT